MILKKVINPQNYLLLFIFFLAISCNPGRVYHEKYTFEDYQWQKEEKVVFKPVFTAEEVQKKYQIQFNIRHIQGFQPLFLNLYIEITRPDGSQAEKEESIQIRSDKEEYLGDGAGSYWDLDHTIKETFKFDQPGEYIIKLLPVTEDKQIYFMNEIGLSIIEIKE